MTPQKEAIRFFHRGTEVQVNHGRDIGIGKITGYSGSFFSFRGRRKGLGGGTLELSQLPPSAFSLIPVKVA